MRCAVVSSALLTVGAIDSRYCVGLGKKTDGEGLRNKATVAREAAIAVSGLSPLDYAVSVMWDENDTGATTDRWWEAGTGKHTCTCVLSSS
jgi:hypothetical protein